MSRVRTTDATKKFLAGAFLFAAVVAAHFPASRNAFIWDDDSYLTQNVLVQSSAGLGKIWFEPLASPQYYPLVFSTFWLEHRLWGLNPSGYHWVNILLHAGATVLLWLTLQRLSVPGACLAALWFGIHPVHVESVAWITERKNVLSGFLYLASFLACLRAFRLDGGTPADTGERSGRTAYASALFLFAGALLSKTVTATLPVSVAIVYWWKHGRTGGPMFWSRLAPFLLLGGIAGGSTAWLEANHVGAKGADWSLSAIERILVAGRALWFYAGKLAWPSELIFIYPRWKPDPGNPFQYIPPLGAVALVLFLWGMKDRLGRGPLAAACYFGVTLAPALGFLNVYPMRYSFVADHFQYLASIGVLALFAAAATRVAKRLEEKVGGAATIASVVLAILVSGLLAGLSWRQAAWYRDALTLWERTAEQNPSAAIAHWNIVNRLAETNRQEETLPHLQILLRISPHDPDVPIAIGSSYSAMKMYQAALPWFERGLRMSPRDVIAMNGAGDAYSSLGENKAAEHWYRKATDEKTATDNEVAYACEGLGLIAVRAGKTSEARQWFEKGLRAAPDTASLHYNLALLLSETGQDQRAVPEYLEALRLDPGHLMARMNLAEIYAKSGESAKADEEFLEIERRFPGKAEALYARGRLLERTGRPESSMTCFRRAAEASTAYPRIHEMARMRIRRQGISP